MKLEVQVQLFDFYFSKYLYLSLFRVQSETLSYQSYYFISFNLSSGKISVIVREEVCSSVITVNFLLDLIECSAIRSLQSVEILHSTRFSSSNLLR